MSKYSSKPISDKVRRYIDLYDGDMKSAAKGAGLSYQYCKQLMTMEKHKRVQDLIRNREDTKSNQRIANREERQEFWSNVLRGKEKQPVITGKDTKGNKTVKDLPPQMVNRLKASELLGRSECDFTDKHQHTGADGGPIKTTSFPPEPEDLKEWIKQIDAIDREYKKSKKSKKSKESKG